MPPTTSREETREAEVEEAEAPPGPDSRRGGSGCGSPVDSTVEENEMNRLGAVVPGESSLA
jgi:hypothetical protein